MNEALVEHEKYSMKKEHNFSVATKSGKGQPWCTVKTEIIKLTEAYNLANSLKEYEAGIFIHTDDSDGYIYWTSLYKVLNHCVIYMEPFNGLNMSGCDESQVIKTNKKIVEQEKHSLEKGHSFGVFTKFGKGQRWIMVKEDIALLTNAFKLANSIKAYEVGILADIFSRGRGFCIYWTSRSNILNDTVIYNDYYE